MNVVTLEFKKCCQCEARATKKLELLEFDEMGVVGPSDPKHYCDVHFPTPMDEDQLRLLLDTRDSEIEKLRAALKGIEIALARDSDIDGAMKIVLEQTPIEAKK